MTTRSVVRTAISFALAGVFLYLAFRTANFASLWNTVLHADLIWVLMLIPIGALSHYVRAIRWKYLLLPIKEHVSIRNLFSCVIIGYAVNNVLPRVGEIVRPVMLGKLEGVSRSAALGTVIIERMLDFLTFSFTVGITLTVYPAAIDPFVDDPTRLQPLFLAGSIVASVVFVLLFLKMEWLVGVLDRIRTRIPGAWSTALGRFLQSFRAGLDTSHVRTTWPWLVLWSVVMWILYALGLYVAFFFFPEVARLHLGFGSAIVLLVITTIAWALPAPGAMGTYHSFLAAALTGLYGVDSTSALGMAVITHEVGFLLVMALAGYYYFADRKVLSAVETERIPT